MSVKTEPISKSTHKKTRTPSVMPTDPIQRTMVLCATYARKLTAIKKQVLKSKEIVANPLSYVFSNPFTKHEEPEEKLNRLCKLSRPLVRAAEDLARYASGIIENSNLEQLDRIELRLRSAELESVLIELQELTTI